MAQQDTLKRFRGPGKTAFWNARPQHWMDRVGIVFQPQQKIPEVPARALADFAANYLDIRSPLLTHHILNESSLYAVVSKGERISALAYSDDECPGCLESLQDSSRKPNKAL